MEMNYTLRATLTLATGYEYALDGSEIVGFALREGVRGSGMLLGAAPAAWGRLTLLDPAGAWRPGGSRLGTRTLSGATVLVEVDAGSGYAAAGCFIVSRIEAREGESQVVLSGYDNMAHALGAPFTDSLTYPQTLGDILSHIVSQTGLTLIGSPACNASVAIARKPDWGDGCTLRRALGWAAGAMGCFVRFDHAGALTLAPAWPGGTATLLPPSQALRLSVSEQDFALERVRIKPRSAREAASVEAAVSGSADATAANTLEIGDNALFRPDAPELQTLADGLLAALQGMTLAPFEGEFFRLPGFAPGERVSVRGLDGTDHASQVFSVTLELDGAPSQLLSCEPDTSGVSLPMVLSGSGLLSGSALGEGVVTARSLAAGSVDSEKLAARSVTAEKLAAGAVTAEKLAVGAVSADAITSGKLSTDRLIIGGTEFSIVRALNQLAQTIVAGDERISGSVLADGTISAVKVTNDFGTGLELSSNAAILLLAGLLDGTNSHMELTEDAINMIGGEINIATDDLQICGMESGEEILSLTPADGLSTKRVVTEALYAPNVVQIADAATIPWKGTIQESLDAVPKYLMQPMTLTIPAGTYSEDVEISGFLGELTLQAGGAVTITGTLSVRNCGRVSVLGTATDDLIICPNYAMPATVDIACCQSVHLRYVDACGYRGRTDQNDGSACAIRVAGGSAMILDSAAEFALDGIVCQEAAVVYVENCVGGQSGSTATNNVNLQYGIHAKTGSHVTVNGTVPMGASAAQHATNATITGTGTPTAGGWSYTPPSSYTTVFALQNHCRYIFGEGTSTTHQYVGQGRNGAYSGSGRGGWRMGAWWFDLSGLSGATITSASLRFRRVSAGYSNVTVKVYAFDCTYANRAAYSIPEQRLSSAYVSGTVRKETELTLDVTSLITSGFITGGWALAVYEPRFHYNDSQQWSDNYTNFYSLGSGYEPVLTVTYEI